MNWLAKLMMSEGRPKADSAFDDRRRAADTLSLAELEPAHSVLELEPGKGWFTGLLLELIDSSGKLVVQQPSALDAFFGKDARRRVERTGKPHARYSSSSWEELDAQDASIDRVIWLQGPHELWFMPQPEISFGRPSKVFSEIERVLRPNGKFLLIDNLAPSGIDQASAGALHRSVPDELKALIEAAGLSLSHEDRDWIIEPDDPLDVPTYDPKAHLKTRQFAQLYTK
ncbi:methyltransferase domain-containing protein [uncultured Tateyamaria sp.]|uniref:methyltransferase domain-containing protein n=1 Tax=uncultured Tateyamaria sp. TaxID=455651 RepID=UPI0026392413|nr:methyltransferase domain-containing protein [uncultured Tateyamaria sp.]